MTIDTKAAKRHAFDLRDVIENEKAAWPPRKNTTVGKIMLDSADTIDALCDEIERLKKYAFCLHQWESRVDHEQCSLCELCR